MCAPCGSAHTRSDDALKSGLAAIAEALFDIRDILVFIHKPPTD
jgi:hypothetical protein